MESLGEILKRRPTPKATSEENSRASSRVEEKDAAPQEVGAQDQDGDQDAKVTCTICKGAGYIRVDVPFGHPDFGRAIPCQCRLKELQERRISGLLEHSNLGPLARLTFANFDESGRSGDPTRQEHFRAVCTEARSFAENPEGWLVLEGASGSGKTHLAAAIANRCIERGQQVLFLVTPDLLDHLRSTFGPASEITYDELFDLVRNVPVLVLDDFSMQSTTPWSEEKLFQIVNHRYNAQLPTVFVVNPSIKALDDRLRSRLGDLQLSKVLLVEQRRSPIFEWDDALELELLRKMTFDKFKRRQSHLSPEQQESLEHVYQSALSFAENPENWLVLIGPIGCGKTHLAAAIANYRRSKGQPVLFVVVPDLLDHLRATFSPESRVTYDELFDAVRSAPVLILDDLGTESASPWAQEKLFQIINHRYNARLPTVITTNEHLEHIDPRLSSRMVDPSVSMPMGLKVPDFRRASEEGTGTRPPTRKPDRRQRGRP